MVVLSPIKITFQIRELQTYLFCDQMTYSSFKEYMSNSTKGIIVTTNFIKTCPLDHPMGHTMSIS